MGAPYNNIDTKVEAALSEVITDAISAATLSLTDHGVIRTGIDDDLTEENNVTCYVDAASESFAVSGVWEVNCIVSINTNLDATNALANHKSNVAKIRDLFMDDGLVTTLNASDEDILVSGIQAYSVSNATDNRYAVGNITFGIIVSAS